MGPGFTVTGFPNIAVELSNARGNIAGSCNGIAATGSADDPHVVIKYSTGESIAGGPGRLFCRFNPAAAVIAVGRCGRVSTAL